MSELIIILITILFSAFFSGMEIAFVSANKLRIELDKKQGTIPSRVISVFTSNPGQYIVTMLIGNNIALVIFGIFMAFILKPFISGFTESEINILLLQTLISTLLILASAEFLPKALFRINPNGFLNLLCIPVLLFFYLFYPISRLTILLSSFILNIFTGLKDAKTRESLVFSKIDIDDLVGNSQGDIKTEEDDSHGIKIFQNALDFSKVKLRECMVPRTEIVALEVKSSVEELHQTFMNSGLSKILIYKNNIDNIIGYFPLKDLLKNPKNIKSKLVTVSIVPETMPANKLLELFVEEQKSIAVVVDEFGGTSGMVTIEDILEEIFGEIEDEHDSSELIEKQISVNEYIFSGRLEIDYLNEKYKLDLPEIEEYETLAGFILFHHNSIPKPNQRILIEQYEIKVLKVTETRLELVNLKIHGK
ncbi:MAG: HlyC/CorC family transporter [Bacteroidales bacterium]|nr:MAG: HlyC/CorC family transporter [Bacteroidales bacterium]